MDTSDLYYNPGNCGFQPEIFTFFESGDNYGFSLVFHRFLIGPGRFFSRKTQWRGAGGLGFLACSRLSRQSPICPEVASHSAIYVL